MDRVIVYSLPVSGRFSPRFLTSFLYLYPLSFSPAELISTLCVVFGSTGAATGTRIRVNERAT